MRQGSALIRDTWARGGPFIGALRAVGRVTVEVGWELRAEMAPGSIAASKVPVRWFQRLANDQVETEVPNVRTINIDRSLDNDAATCDITLTNQWMKANTAAPELAGQLGSPGYFTFDRGVSPMAKARWNHTANAWLNVLTPNALLRTYEGFGGATGPIADAQAAGHLVLTGLWLVDEVRVNSKGELALKCRDMAKLLIEQQLYPPLVPRQSYPLRYCRWLYVPETRQRVVEEAVASAGRRNLTYDTSANLAWYDAGVVHGHSPADAFDGDDASFYLSVGNSGPEEPYSVEWVQGNCGEYIDTVGVYPYMGGYKCYVSILENGAWVDEIGTIAYEEAGIGRYNGAYEARIPAVMQFGVPWEAAAEVRLPRAYKAEKVRFTFTNLAESQWGPYPFRAGARNLSVGLSSAKATSHTVSETVIAKYDGNYRDFADIVKELLLWAGFWLQTASPSGEPSVFGNIESTGSYAEDCFPDDAFDKRPVIDAITTIKEAVGYVFWVDDDGGARFESPNWWSPGNFVTETGEHTEEIPELDESVQLTDYSMAWSDRPARSEISIASADPYSGLADVLVTTVVPPTAASLRGIVKPAMWINHLFTSRAEQQTMAELVALHTWFAQRQGSVTAWANPLIQLGDQVRIFERLAAETYVHYVRGIQTTLDTETGRYMMTLTTHWLGDADDWAVRP